MRRALGVAALALIAAAIAGCDADTGEAGEGPLLVYMALADAGSADGLAIAAGAEDALAEAGGKAGDYEIGLQLLRDGPGGRGWDPVTVAANARTATEDADTIAYIGDNEPGATATSLPITDLAEIPQVVLGPIPRETDVENEVEGPASGAPREIGARAVKMVLDAIEAAGEDGNDRVEVLEQLRQLSGAGDD